MEGATNREPMTTGEVKATVEAAASMKAQGTARVAAAVPTTTAEAHSGVHRGRKGGHHKKTRGQNRCHHQTTWGRSRGHHVKTYHHRPHPSQ